MSKIKKVLFLLTLFSCSNGGQDHTPSAHEKVEDQRSTFQEQIKSFEDQFYKRDLEEYDCSLFKEFYSEYRTLLNTNKLHQLNDSSVQRIFGDYTNEYGTFKQSLLYSMDGKIHEFYPITVIQGFGVANRPLVMVLFDQKGQAINSIEVANLYGESGGCLSSEFANDSTLLQNFEWNEFGFDTLTNKDLWETTFRVQETTIKHNGQISTKVLKSWTETSDAE